jgi:MFS transporter, putative metabolite transport protein
VAAFRRGERVAQNGLCSSGSSDARLSLRIWALACAGKFFEGMVVLMTGVALPLISIEFALKTSDKGFHRPAAHG